MESDYGANSRIRKTAEGAAHVEGSYAAVQGWLVRGPVHPCPSNPRNPVVSYGCPTDDWLSESEFQPLQPNGSTVGPPAAIYLSSGSYDRWAPNPEPTGPDGRGVEPREATYLLQIVSDGCNDFAACLPPPPTWRIVGRFDPWPDTVAPSPDPTRLDNTVPAPSGDAWTVAQLADRPLGDGTFVVRGWLVGTPALRCPKAAAPSGEPDYSCNEVDWLTDEAFQPWFADGSTGGTREPALGIRVQNGAYAAFAPSPATGEFAARTPRFGDWVVRETTRGRSCSIGSACAVPTIHWEVIARLP